MIEISITEDVTMILNGNEMIILILAGIITAIAIILVFMGPLTENDGI